tara:strand:- start:60 stop:485 length:426 start_codon:yes stop_codon:yes gene_type:complete
MTYKEKYEQLAEQLVGDDAIYNYSKEELINEVNRLKDIEKKYFYGVKPTIDTVTLQLINKLKKIDDTINEGAWEYIHLGDIIRLQDASQEAISHFDLRKEGGIHDYGADKGKYQQFWHSDYVCHTDPNAFDPSKVEEEDDE